MEDENLYINNIENNLDADTTEQSSPEGAEPAAEQDDCLIDELVSRLAERIVKEVREALPAAADDKLAEKVACEAKAALSSASDTQPAAAEPAQISYRSSRGGRATRASSYTVTFVYGRCGGDSISQIVAAGEKATKPRERCDSPCSFDGWYTGVNAGDPQYDFDTPVNADIRLYAHCGCNSWCDRNNNCGPRGARPLCYRCTRCGSTDWHMVWSVGLNYADKVVVQCNRCGAIQEMTIAH